MPTNTDQPTDACKCAPTQVLAYICRFSRERYRLHVEQKFIQARRPTVFAQQDAPPAAAAVPTAREVALRFYESYNEKRMDKVMELIAPDCVYQGGG